MITDSAALCAGLLTSRSDDPSVSNCVEAYALPGGLCPPYTRTTEAFPAVLKRTVGFRRGRETCAERCDVAELAIEARALRFLNAAPGSLAYVVCLF